jgi:hypothetical protein
VVLHLRRIEVAVPAITAISPSASPRCAGNLWASLPASSPRSLNTMVQGTPERSGWDGRVQNLAAQTSSYTARHRKRYLMPAARINLSFELSSAVTYMSISAGVIGIGLIASCFSLCRIAGVASTLVAVEWNFSTIARAV